MQKIIPFLIAVLILGFAIWLGFALLNPKKQAPLQFAPAGFSQLPGWSSDNLTGALSAFQKSCDALLKLPKGRKLPGAEVGGTVADWFDTCEVAIALPNENEPIREFFETAFQPLAVSLRGETQGLFTGYFEALLEGSFEKTARYNYPLYGIPRDLISVDLGSFRSDLKGSRIAGKIEKNRLIPYEDRRDIDAGAIKDRANVLLWVDDPVDAFFLHIQGSGRVQLPGGNFQGIGYAGQNGHIYRAIGRDLIEAQEVRREDMSMQAIRSWLMKNKDKAEALMHRNRSYIFFRLLETGDGPFGSANVALTPEHSLAVDLRHLPLHAPMWLSTSRPLSGDEVFSTGDRVAAPFNRLMIAQDTGGAITGEIRGDVFWGFGEQAANTAGKMASRGSYWLLLPNDLAARVLETQNE